MFKKLRNKIIIITMAITTAVLLVAGSSIMLFSSTLRPEPKPFAGPAIFDAPDNDQELRDYIKNDRKEGSSRLLATLLSVGITVEVIVFLISYYLSEKIVAPVKESYDKQKLFIANASHELKTPLAVIEANMEAIEVAKGSEEWKNNIENEITHANKLVLDLLKLAKMDAGGITKSPSEQVDLNATIGERIEIFKPKFTGKIVFSKKAKDTKRLLPKQDFLQVLDILLDNATKYGDKKISVVLNQNEFMVINDGKTIDKKDLEKIFDRFYQTDKTKEGSGLGLAIAKAICSQNGWQISCESDKNTKFIVRF
ncbi:MAG: HAMP domain-containing sensor histidine kinase [Candidatus Saccharibacteria bacterium]|nr:HAMP domain-containing sensor histidine kinase [Candidatus Saccharibacteria bacterium]